MTTNLQDQTPQQIDEVLAELYTTTYLAHARILQAQAQHQQELDRLDRGGWQAKFAPEAIARLEEAMPKLTAAWEAARAAEGPYRAEFNRRGGWTRAYLVVTNGVGHVHKSMRCSSCHPTTQFHWLTQLSDHAETEIVEQAGERACTFCYPTAPVEVLARPTQLFTKDEVAAQAARAERDAKRAKARAEKIVVEGIREYGGPRTKEFKSLRAATNFISSELSSLCWYGMEHPDAAKWASNVQAVREAIQASGAEYDYDKALASARKKAVRDGREARF